MSLRYKVWRPFPVEWQEAELKLGDIFEVVAVDIWREVGGGYNLVGSPLTTRPDISDARLRWLLKNGYIEQL